MARLVREEYPRNLERAIIDLKNNKYPKQKQFIFSSERWKGFDGGNRSAKTTTCVLDMLMEVLGKHPLQKEGKLPQPPVHWWACTKSWKKVDGVLAPEILRWTPKGALKRYDSRNHIFYFNNGSRIDILVYEQEPGEFASDKLHGIMLDEVEECKETQWEECLVRVIDYHGRITMNGTFVFGRNFVYDKVYLPSLEEDSDILWLKVSIWDNPYIPDKEKEEALKGLDGDVRKVREFGGWIEFAGLVWPEFDRKTHCIPRFELDFEKEIDGKKVVVKPTRYMAVDPMGRAIACLWIAVYPNERAIVYDELWIENASYEEIVKEILEHDGGPIKRRWIDWNAWSPGAGGGTTLASELFKASKKLGQRMGFAPAQKGPGSVKKGILIVSEYLKRKDVNGHPLLLFFDDLKMTKYQISHFVYGGSRKTEEKHDPSPKPKDKQKDFPDCLRYILSTRPVYIPPQGTIIRSPISGKIMSVKSPYTGWIRNIPKRS